MEAYDVGIDLRRFRWVQIRISEDGRKRGAARITRRAAPGLTLRGAPFMRQDQ